MGVNLLGEDRYGDVTEELIKDAKAKVRLLKRQKC